MNDKHTTRVPQQARSIKKRQRLMDAAMNEFSEKGFQGANAKGIAKAAGVSVGTFYAYFTDKKALLLEIINQHIDEIDRSVFKELTSMIESGASGRDIMKRTIELGHQSHTHSPELLGVMLSMKYTDEDFNRYAIKESGQIISKLSTFFEDLQERLRVTDMEAAAQVVCYALEETMHTVAVFGPTIEQERLYDALADMTATYLFKDPDAPLRL